MSSHHIVREKQEPALYIASPDQLDEEQLGQLLEWSPYVVAGAGAYEVLHARGIKIDALAGTPEQHVQEHITLIPPLRNELLSVLTFLQANGHAAVHCITAAFDAETLRGFSAGMTIVTFAQGEKIYPVKSGYSKWLPAGETLRLMHDVPGLETEGLKNRCENGYDTIADGFFRLRFDAPLLFIAEAL